MKNWLRMAGAALIFVPLVGTGALAQTQAGRPIGPRVGYYSSPSYSEITFGGVVTNGGPYEYVTSVGCFSWPKNVGLMSSPDAHTWLQTTGSGNPPPALGTYVTDIHPQPGVFNNSGDMSLTQVNPAYVSPMDWGMGLTPSMYLRNPYVGQPVWADRPAGYIQGTVLALSQHLGLAFSVGSRAPKLVYNLCDINESPYYYSFYGLVATDMPNLAVDLGAWLQSRDTGSCHQAEASLVVRNVNIILNGQTLTVSMWAPLTNEFPYFGVHVAGGNVCGSGPLANPVTGELAPAGTMENVVQAQLHDPRVPDWRPTAESPQFLKAQRAWKKAHPEQKSYSRLAPALEAEYSRAGEVANDHAYDSMLAHWRTADRIPVRQVGPDVEGGKVVIVIGIVGPATAQDKAIIWHDLGAEHTLGGFPVRIFGINTTGEDPSLH